MVCVDPWPYRGFSAQVIPSAVKLQAGSAAPQPNVIPSFHMCSAWVPRLAGNTAQYRNLVFHPAEIDLRCTNVNFSLEGCIHCQEYMVYFELRQPTKRKSRSKGSQRTWWAGRRASADWVGCRRDPLGRSHCQHGKEFRRETGNESMSATYWGDPTVCEVRSRGEGFQRIEIAKRMVRLRFQDLTDTRTRILCGTGAYEGEDRVWYPSPGGRMHDWDNAVKKGNLAEPAPQNTQIRRGDDAGQTAPLRCGLEGGVRMLGRFGGMEAVPLAPLQGFPAEPEPGYRR
ncbi:hypothetical protein B0H14DRAFT_2606739 [Mycena olivaceomarginata]|nr:hypothetical protein B0H14DRAFT_2606739 [Mycena olivaceomarginata]